MGAFVDIGGGDGEGFVEIQPPLVGAADADAVGLLGLEVDGLLHQHLVANNLEEAVVVAIAGSLGELVGEVVVNDLVIGSVVVRIPTSVPLGLFSATVLGSSEMSVGASLTFSTVSGISCSKVAPALSVARTRRVRVGVVSASKGPAVRTLVPERVNWALSAASSTSVKVSLSPASRIDPGKGVPTV